VAWLIWQAFGNPARYKEHSTMKKSIVLLSGGLDSAVCLAMAAEQSETVSALHLSYGQATATAELERSRRLCEQFGAVLITMSISLPEAVSAQSMLTSGADIAQTYVPQRNALLLSLAGMVAESQGANTVWIGANVVDYSGYPDCRPRFLAAMERALHLGSERYAAGGRGIEIRTPLLYLPKPDIVSRALAAGIDLDDTISCYRSDPPCGECESCKIRIRAVSEAS
jgi:7-cyano-7-deazaguanine synthase